MTACPKPDRSIRDKALWDVSGDHEQGLRIVRGAGQDTINGDHDGAKRFGGDKRNPLGHRGSLTILREIGPADDDLSQALDRLDSKEGGDG